MKFSAQVIVHPGDDTKASAVIREVLTFDRDDLAPDTLGLQLAEAKDLPAAVQATMAGQQATAAIAKQVACPHCGYVHSSQQRSRADGWFEVIAGKAIPADGRPACFGYVQTYDTKPRRRLFEVLRSQGMQANQQVTFLTHGSEDIRDIPCYLNAQAEHLLDWFHLTMRITVMANMAKSLRPPPPDPEFPDIPPADLAGEVAAQLERLKWFCWHGNVFRALQIIDDILVDLDTAEAGPEQARLLRAVCEFDSYIRANADRIPNYGERHRAGEAISTAFTESAINQVIAKRMVKKQQMRWTPRGAHLLLQVRTRVLNDQLAGDFHRWYPGLSRTPDPMTLAA